MDDKIKSTVPNTSSSEIKDDLQAQQVTRMEGHVNVTEEKKLVSAGVKQTAVKEADIRAFIEPACCIFPIGMITNRWRASKIYEVRLQSDNNRERILYLIDKKDLDLFKEMVKWRRENNSKTMENAIDEFGDRYDSNNNRPTFDDVLTWIRDSLLGDKNDSNNNRPKVGDALARILYNDKFPDFIFKFEPKGFTKSTDDASIEISEEFKSSDQARRKFELLLLLSGLFVEREITRDVTYVKIWTPFKKLCEAAEEIRIKKELVQRAIPNENDDNNKTKENHEDSNNKTNKKLIDNIYEFLYQKITPYFVYKINLDKRLSFFRADQFDKYKDVYEYKKYSDIVLHFWNSSTRNLLTYYFITDANRIMPEGIPEALRLRSWGFDSLMEKNVYDAFYPLHDGEIIQDQVFRDPNNKKENLRAKLFNNWIKSLKRQPLSEIREYFGEKLAMYFAWLGLYTSWLFVASIFGIITIIYGIIDFETTPDNVSNGVPRVTKLWDNAFTVVFAFFMSIWATCFLESWKRYNAALAHDWGVTCFKKNEQSRPGFRGTVSIQSKVTNKKELVFPPRKRFLYCFASIILIIVSILIVIATTETLLLLSKKLFGKFGALGSFISSIINLGVVLILSPTYKRLAIKLTELENPRTATRFEDSHILKVYLFDFVIFYGALFYILIVKQKFAGKILRISDYEGCEYNSCMVELNIQLAVILIGKQTVGQIEDLALPLFKKKFDSFMNPWKKKFNSFINSWKKKKSSQKELNEETKKVQNEEIEVVEVSSSKDEPNESYPWILDDQLLPTDKDDLREDYEQMAIQFGFIALFAAAFPLAPLCAWFHNIIEIHTDGYKYLKLKRRTISSLAQSIGMWDNIIYMISIFAVLTNASILAFHSNYMQSVFKKYVGNDDSSLLNVRLGFILIFENIVFLVKFLLSYLIPVAPTAVKLARKRCEYLERVAIAKTDIAKRALAVNEYKEGEENEMLEKAKNTKFIYQVENVKLVQ
ncbi:5146_t:CDS:10 [Ambispora leptoticha]|uniref:5146_t:CDS:1 n=1 Tax=Ambispora leptoticha TaxID=144679 RepID=A0A9N9A3S4_9GLOM|nr:5146_t:CDS:10 [Ambispora leptoticha]